MPDVDHPCRSPGAGLTIGASRGSTPQKKFRPRGCAPSEDIRHSEYARSQYITIVDRRGRQDTNRQGAQRALVASSLSPTTNPWFATVGCLPGSRANPECDGGVAQFLGNSRVKPKRLFTHRMLERELLGVQPESMMGYCHSVQRVGVDRISDGREVDPDLVCPTRL